MRRLAGLLLLLLAFAALGPAACGSGSQGGFPQGGAYIALGDSLSEGVGASDRAQTAFVPLVRGSLDREFELINLGHSGDTSRDLLEHGHLDRAVDEIRQRRGDDDPANDVALVTLEVGGNDLLRLLPDLVIAGPCPSLEAALQREKCVEPLRTTFRRFEENLETAVDRLRDADPDLVIVLMTLYNPFSGTPIVGEVGDLALEGARGTRFPEGVNDIVRARAEKSGALLADLYPLFRDRADELISWDFIHPNDEGYRLMAEAVIAALQEVR